MSINVIKQPTTYCEQIEILKAKGIIIDDPSSAEYTLSLINYYRFTGVILPFKDTLQNKYLSLTFERAFRIYEFDRKLRNLVLRIFEPLEIALRTRLAYYHAHKYGPLGYLHSNNFDNINFHNEFLVNLQHEYQKNRSSLIVKHHVKKYNGLFPFWVAVEFFSFGMLSRFIANLFKDDQESISSLFNDIPIAKMKSWLHCLTILRNRCAHQCRLYGYQAKKIPAKIHDCSLPRNNFLFYYLLRSIY